MKNSNLIVQGYYDQIKSTLKEYIIGEEEIKEYLIKKYSCKT